MAVRMMMRIVSVLALVPSAYGDFMPENKLHLEDNIPTMSKEQFDAVLDKAEAHYKPLIKEAFGAELRINRLWKNETVNASAYQDGDYWYLNMYGGLARRVTEDGFLTVICHELGHHLGAYPFYSFVGGDWAATEGQSDYYATLHCVKKILGDDVEGSLKSEQEISAYPKSLCDQVYKEDQDRRLCYRTMLGAKSTADLLGWAKFETPDRRVVAKTFEGHPDAQCRLDTYMQGALCNLDWNESVIPGKDLGSRQNSYESEKLSAENGACHALNGSKIGLRPKCWFASKIK